MNDSQVRDMVISHDKVLDSLSDSIKALTGVTSNTNIKLDKVVEELAKQNVLMERVNNMDRELGDSFKRVHHRLDKLEETKEGGGCNAVKFLGSTVKDQGVRVKDIEEKVEAVENELPSKVSYSFVQWALVIIAGYTIAFGTYTVQTMHALDNKDTTIMVDTKHIKNTTSNLIKRVQENEDLHAAMGVTKESVK